MKTTIRRTVSASIPKKYKHFFSLVYKEKLLNLLKKPKKIHRKRFLLTKEDKKVKNLEEVENQQENRKKFAFKK